MGTYYTFVNHTKKEYVDPGDISDEKRFWAAFGDSGRLLGYLMLYRWNLDHVQVIGDGAEDPPWRGCRDVTAEVVAEFNRDSHGMVPAIAMLNEPTPVPVDADGE